MLRRLVGLAVPAVIVGTTLTAPAYAANNVICVQNPVGVTCNAKVATIQQAINAANANGLADTIYVAPGHYTDGPYSLSGTPEPLTLQGSGQGSTYLELPAAAGQTYVTANGATVEDLTVAMTGAQSEGDVGITAINATIQRVAVDGTSTSAATAIDLSGGSVSASTLTMTRTQSSNTRGIYSSGAAQVSDTAIVADEAYRHSGGATTAVLSRLSIRASFAGISTQAGSVIVDDTLIDLGTFSNSVGILASNENPGTDPKSVAANHVTIVGGAGNSVGVRAWSLAANAVQHSTVQLQNSLISGPVTGLEAVASNNGSLGSNSVATITTSYSNWSTKTAQSGTGGSATITSGAGHLNVDPKFRDPAAGDYRLAAGSPVIDRGAAGTGSPTLDLDRHPRVLDGTGDGVAVRDMGAYEAPKVPDVTPPNTVIGVHPPRITTKRYVTFRFRSNEAHVTFRCRLDARPWRVCTSPRTVQVARGAHVFRVRARDAAGNFDPTPALWRFKRV